MKHGLKIVSVVAVVAGSFVVLAPPAAAGGFCRGTELTQGTGDAVIMKGMCYEPVVLFTEPGTEVSFTNVDKAPHTVTGSGGWGTAHEEISNSKTKSFSFKKEGVYPYVCLLHPGMVGAVVVGDGRDGKVSASNVGFIPPAADSEDPSSQAPIAAPVEGSNGALTTALGIAVAVLVAIVVALLARRRRIGADPAGPPARAIG